MEKRALFKRSQLRYHREQMVLIADLESMSINKKYEKKQRALAEEEEAELLQCNSKMEEEWKNIKKEFDCYESNDEKEFYFYESSDEIHNEGSDK